MKTKDLKKLVSKERNSDVPKNDMEQFLLDSFGIKDYNKPSKTKPPKNFRHD